MKTALLIIDVQVGLVALMPRDLREDVLKNIATLLARARSTGTAVIFVQHDGPKGHPLEVGTKAWEIHSTILPLSGEPVVRKPASDSFFETRLAECLSSQGVTSLIIAGGMTEYCIDTTCRRAVSLGYDVTLVSDGHFTRDTSVLPALEIVTHHNQLLDGFAAGSHEISVWPADQVSI
ncbi:MAG: cysteine hydrolase family protein [Terriglobales bacterium]|jgi:nicotinamidase-related amidase